MATTPTARSKRAHASGSNSISFMGGLIMQRKPFLPQFKMEAWALGPNVINKRSEFIAAIGKCLALWPFVEHQMTLLLGVLMKAENNATVAVFNALRTGRAQRDALNAAAVTTLDPPMLRLFEAVLSVLQSTSDDRAAVAHGHWGVLVNHADKLLWVESKFHSPWNTLVLNKQDSGNPWVDSHEGLHPHLYVVTIPDIEQVYTDIDEMWKILFDFLNLVRGQSVTGIFRKRGDELFQHLYLLPRIAAAIDRQHRRQNETLARLQQRQSPPQA